MFCLTFVRAFAEDVDRKMSDANKIVLERESYAVVGAALEVLKEIGHGFHEKPYENALVVELSRRGIPCQQQTRFDLIYKGVKVSEFIPDLITEGRIIIDAKVIEKISEHEKGRMINYLRITGLNVGLIFNFRRAKLEWARIVLTDRERSIAPPLIPS
jgi:GxxExxY protein